MYFRRADFHIIREEEIPKNVIRWCRAWDIAATEPTEGVDPDATSGTLMGITEDSKIIVAGRINVKIAAGSVVLNEIPENCTAVGTPAQVVKRDGVRVDPLDQVHIPDPVAQELERLNHRVAELEEALRRLNP